MKVVKKTPYAYTSKAEAAALTERGVDVFVIQVTDGNLERRYAASYWFRANVAFRRPGGMLWEGKFKYKLTVAYPSRVDGACFDEPLHIEKREVVDWLRTLTLGAEQIPEQHWKYLRGVFADPANGASSLAE